mgnify:CR=1 FL=1
MILTMLQQMHTQATRTQHMIDAIDVYYDNAPQVYNEIKIATYPIHNN